jgi:hypothetical protein
VAWRKRSPSSVEIDPYLKQRASNGLRFSILGPLSATSSMAMGHGDSGSGMTGAI